MQSEGGMAWWTGRKESKRQWEVKSIYYGFIIYWRGKHDYQLIKSLFWIFKSKCLAPAIVQQIDSALGLEWWIRESHYGIIHDGTAEPLPSIPLLCVIFISALHFRVFISIPVGTRNHMSVYCSAGCASLSTWMFGLQLYNDSLYVFDLKALSSGRALANIPNTLLSL